LNNSSLIWNNDDELLSVFSLKSTGLFPGGVIPGMNIGLNTAEEKESVLVKRELFLHQFGISAAQVAFANQIHSTEIYYVQSPGTYDGVDGFVTDKPDLALAIQVADCAAVLLADRKNGILGAAHVGWRGAAGNIVLRTITSMETLGGSTEHMEAWVSPCIGVKRFEVGEEVAAHFPDTFIIREMDKKPHIDLKGFIRHQLEGQHILPENIRVDPGCTYDHPDQYYSYRREKDRSGRMMAMIMLRSSE
jgi:polyphenol oxidase